MLDDSSRLAQFKTMIETQAITRRGNINGTPANLRPPWTPEEARRVSLQYHAERRKREEAERLKPKQTANTPKPEPDQARMERIKLIIDGYILDIEKTKSLELKLSISAAIERLWKLVQPTNGKTAKGRGNQPPPVSFTIPATPQASEPSGDQPAI